MSAETSAAAIKATVRQFIVDNYYAAGTGADLNDDDSFLQKGIIDSIGVIELTSFIQNEYGFKISVTDIVPENFDTVNRLTRYIQKKLERGA